MRRDDVRVCILRIEGTNCEQELWQCFRRIGAKPEIVHLNQLTSSGIPVKLRRKLSDYHILMIPGGFSAGDYVRAGAIWAARIKSRMKKDIARFIEEGRAVGGVCNGFQVLVELGIVPGIGGSVMSDEPQAVLSINDSSRFECRPTYLKMINNGKCIFTRAIPKGRILNIPSAHAEGKLIFQMGHEKKILEHLIENDQIVFRYVDPDGNMPEYPWNPNGACYDIAGMCNETGNAFGMMPHPERVYYRYQHPDWTREIHDERGITDAPVAVDAAGDGMLVFKSVMDYITRMF